MTFRILVAIALASALSIANAQDTLCRNAAAGQVDGVPCFPLDGRFYRAGPNDGIELDAIKGTVVADVTGTANTLTIHFADGATEDVTVVEDGVLANAAWSTANQTLTLTLDDGTAINVALSGLETAAEVDAAITAAIADRLTRSDLIAGTNITLTPGTGNHVTIDAEPGADGVVQSGVCSGNDLTVSRTEGLPNITFTDVCIGAGAGAGEQNVQADWDVTDTGSDAYIENKPDIPDLSDDAPQSVHTVGTAGAGTEASRDTHRHAGVGTLTCREGIQCNQTVGAVVAEARLSSAAPEPVGATENAGGNDQTISRSRHVHAGVTSIVAGTGVSVSPSDGQGDVTVTATGGGGSADGVADSFDFSISGSTLTGTIGRSGTLADLTDDVELPSGAADGRVDGLVSKTADISVDVIGRTWSNVGAVADGGFYWRSAIPTLAQAAALDSSYVVSVTPTASQATNFYTLLRIPDGHDSRDFRVRQVGDLGTFDTTGWHLIGSQGGFDYHYAQRNLFEGYTVTVQEAVTQTTTHFRGESDAENVTVDASGFSGNLSGTDTDVQTALGTLDTLSVGGGASVTNDVILFGAPENESETVAPSRHAVAIMGEVLDFRTPDSTGTTGHVWTKTATEGEWAAIDAVDIAAYSSSATYERGSRNSIVTHANHVWVYVSTQRNTNHDPEQFPQYWWKIDTPIRVLNHDSATTTHWRSGEFFLTETGELRMATATISASPADIIADHTGADQEFLWLNEPAPISWGFQIDTLLVPELNQDAITDARIILEDSGLTHYLTFLDWTAANLNSISHLPVGAHIGLRQGVTTRILEVEAEWDSTNRRYQVININTGILSESASGTATELLLTAGAGGAGFTLHVGASAVPAKLARRPMEIGTCARRTGNGTRGWRAPGRRGTPISLDRRALRD